MINKCDLLLEEAKIELRSRVIRILRGPDRVLAHDVLLGAVALSDDEPLSELAQKCIHIAVCFYLVGAWKRRSTWYGGVPRRGADYALVMEPNIWEALKVVQRK
jgi:hypothetical protein